MAKIKRRKGVNTPPNISLFGSSLDRLLAGVVTDELKGEVRKARIAESSGALATCAPSVPQGLLVAAAKPPLVAVMVRSTCACRRNEDRFSHLARQTTTRIEGGEVTSFAAILDAYGEKPTAIHWLDESTPYCLYCLPSTLPDLYDDDRTDGNSRYPEQHPQRATSLRLSNGIGDSSRS